MNRCEEEETACKNSKTCCESIFEVRKKILRKSQMVKKICTFDELPPMKHESHNFAWLETSKREKERH